MTCTCRGPLLLTPCLVALLAASAARADAPRPGAKPRALALVWAGDPADDAVRLRITKGVAAALARLGGYALQSEANTVAHLAEARDLGISCDIAITECAARFGTLAAVDEVVRVDLHGDQATLTRVDVARAADVATATIAGSARGAGVEDAAALSFVQVVDPSRIASAVLVQASEPGIEIFLDGRSHGVTPLPGPLVVGPGAHGLEGRVAGRPPFRQELDVPWGTTAKLDVVVPGAPVDEAPVDEAPADGAAVAVAPAAEGGPAISPFMWGGGALAVAGGVCALGAGAALTGIELSLSSPTQNDTRAALATTGQVMTGLTALGVVAAVAGGALIAVAMTGSDG